MAQATTGKTVPQSASGTGKPAETGKPPVQPQPVFRDLASI